MNRKFLAGLLFGVLISAVLSWSLSLRASETEMPPTPSIVVLGKLRLKPEGDAEKAEMLLKQKLLPAVGGIDGLSMTALKRKVLPGQQKERADQPDYIMMAEMTQPALFLKLVSATPGALKEFGDAMKIEAGAPEFELYEVIGSTEGFRARSPGEE